MDVSKENDVGLTMEDYQHFIDYFIFNIFKKG
jgi:hypothetical protein